MSSRITDMDLRNGLSIWTINIVDNWFLRKGNNPGSLDRPIYDDNLLLLSYPIYHPNYKYWHHGT